MPAELGEPAIVPSSPSLRDASAEPLRPPGESPSDLRQQATQNPVYPPQSQKRCMYTYCVVLVVIVGIARDDRPTYVCRCKWRGYGHCGGWVALGCVREKSYFRSVCLLPLPHHTDLVCTILLHRMMTQYLRVFVSETTTMRGAETLARF